MPIITISHEAFGDGRAVAERVAAILGYRCISREVLIEASQQYGIAVHRQLICYKREMNEPDTRSLDSRVMSDSIW
jgi:Cytidylate kinase-like family